MKKIIFLFLSFFIGCGINDANISLEEGNYSGTYTIIEADGQTSSGNINFLFNDNRYSVVPEKAYLPPSGAGIYEVKGNSINITDTAIHTAEFDWTLILNGKFEIMNNNEVLILKQNDIKYRRKRTISLTKQN